MGLDTVSVGLAPAGLAGDVGAGHLFIVLSASDGSAPSVVVEAGPDGPIANGNLSLEDYGNALTASNSFTPVSSTMSGSQMAQLIQDAVSNFMNNSAADEISYGAEGAGSQFGTSAFGYNSNSFVVGLLDSIGFTPDGGVAALTSNTGLSSPGSNTGGDLTAWFSDPSTFASCEATSLSSGQSIDSVYQSFINGGDVSLEQETALASDGQTDEPGGDQTNSQTASSSIGTSVSDDSTVDCDPAGFLGEGTPVQPK